MNTNKILETEKKVLKVYKNCNPSIHFVDKSKKKINSRKLSMDNLILHNLKFPKKMFQGASLLDCGAGTGDTTISFNNWGANCTLIDINDEALTRAKLVFKKFKKIGSKNYFKKQSIFNLKLKKKFDIVTSIGVIHHTEYPLLALKKISKFVKNDGFLILGCATPEGFFQRNLQRYIISNFANLNNGVEVEQVAKYLFKNHLIRAHKFSRRSIKAIIHDTYVNPKIHGLTFDEINKNLQKEFSFYSAAPNIDQVINPDSPLTYNSDYFTRLKNMTLLSNLTWMHNADQYFNYLKNDNKKLKDLKIITNKISKSFNNFSSETKINKKEINKLLSKNITLCKKNLIKTNIINEHKKFLLEVKSLFNNIEKKNINKTKDFLNKNKILFKKSSGLGNNYYIFQKK